MEDILRCLPAFAIEIGGELTEARNEVLWQPLVGLISVLVTSRIESFLAYSQIIVLNMLLAKAIWKRTLKSGENPSTSGSPPRTRKVNGTR